MTHESPKLDKSKAAAPFALPMPCFFKVRPDRSKPSTWKAGTLVQVQAVGTAVYGIIHVDESLISVDMADVHLGPDDPDQVTVKTEGKP